MKRYSDCKSDSQRGTYSNCKSVSNSKGNSSRKKSNIELPIRCCFVLAIDFLVASIKLDPLFICLILA